MAVEAIVLDIGDVLEINPRTGWEDRWAKRLGWSSGEFGRRLSEIWAPGSIGERTLAEVERATAVVLSLDAASLRDMMDDAWAEYLGTLNRELTDYFARLRPRYKTGILSNSFVGAREREQRAYGLQDICDVIVYSHEEGFMKPDPRSYASVCDRLGVAPGAAVLLDDLPENAQGARAAGMHAIVYQDNSQAIAELRALLDEHPA